MAQLDPEDPRRLVPKPQAGGSIIEGLRAALQHRKATPSAIAEAAKGGGAWKIMRPYLEALTSNG